MPLMIKNIPRIRIANLGINGPTRIKPMQINTIPITFLSVFIMLISIRLTNVSKYFMALSSYH
jgi:hypothetical protein